MNFVFLIPQISFKIRIYSNFKWPYFGGAYIFIIVGLFRGFGGIALIINGASLQTSPPMIASDGIAKLVGVGLILMALAMIISALLLWMMRTMRNWWLVVFILTFFLLDGVANGFLLFGSPVDTGQLINFTSAFIIAVLLFFGKPSE